MANPFYATVTTAGATTIWSADYNVAPFTASIQVYVPVGTTVSYEVDMTLDDPNIPQPNGLTAQPQEWVALTAFPAASTGTITSSINFPVAALRLNIASISGGPVYFKIIQGFFIGS